MKSKDLKRTVHGKAVAACLAVATLAAGIVGMPRAQAAAHPRLPTSFSGLLNDYTPPAPGVVGGP